MTLTLLCSEVAREEKPPGSPHQQGASQRAEREGEVYTEMLAERKTTCVLTYLHAAVPCSRKKKKKRLSSSLSTGRQDSCPRGVQSLCEELHRDFFKRSARRECP